MLYFFYGDSKKAGDKANELVTKMLGKKPDASVFVVDSENFSEGILQEMTQSAALFQNKYIVRVKQVLQGKGNPSTALGARSDSTTPRLRGARNGEEKIFDFLKEIKESENIFIWNEGEVNKSDLKKIEKNAEKVVEIGNSQQSKVKRSNEVFGICDPIINRNKKNAWVKYQELLETCSPEEIHGTMFWQFKNIAIVRKANLKDSGLAPYPYQNAKKALSKYSEEEILQKTSELVRIVHDARSVGTELSASLEKFILEL